jgi:hypothetical protein
LACWDETSSLSRSPVDRIEVATSIAERDHPSSGG